MTGGQYDVDLTLEDPKGKTLYKGIKKQYDSHSWKTETDGAYKVCCPCTSQSLGILLKSHLCSLSRVFNCSLSVVPEYFSKLWNHKAVLFYSYFQACFSNEFSTFSHKVVYMDWQKGDEGQSLATNICISVLMS